MVGTDDGGVKVVQFEGGNGKYKSSEKRVFNCHVDSNDDVQSKRKVNVTGSKFSESSVSEFCDLSVSRRVSKSSGLSLSKKVKLRGAVTLRA